MLIKCNKNIQYTRRIEQDFSRGRFFRLFTFFFFSVVGFSKSALLLPLSKLKLKVTSSC